MCTAERSMDSMLVYVPEQSAPLVFDTDTVIVEQGALLVFSSPAADTVVAGFAPGAWSAFSMGSEVMRLEENAD